MGDVINRLIAQRGYLQTLGSEQLREAWNAAAGPQLAGETQTGNVRRGVLEIFASDSCLIQELTFRKRQLLDKLRQVAPDMKIRDLRFRVGVVE
jgi:predicted nucleic acid-binding Zn ribbon protein